MGGGSGGGECACAECEKILRAEYVESRLDCAPPPPTASAPPPPPAGLADGNATACAYSVLDIRFSVWRGAAGAGGAAARAEGADAGGGNLYTGGCRACLAAQPNCSVAGLLPVGAYAATPVDLAFAATSIALELYSFYKFVRGEFDDGKSVFAVTAEIIGKALSGELANKGYFFELPVLILGSLSPLAGVGFTVAKLFPGSARYACATVYCNKLVHNAAMSLASAPFDAAEIVMVGRVEGSEMEKLVKQPENKLGWGRRWFLKYARPLVKGSKSASLGCSAAWIVYDLVQVTPPCPAPPGPPPPIPREPRPASPRASKSRRTPLRLRVAGACCWLQVRVAGACCRRVLQVQAACCRYRCTGVGADCVLWMRVAGYMLHVPLANVGFASVFCKCVLQVQAGVRGTVSYLRCWCIDCG